jgi:hypothetical protein
MARRNTTDPNSQVEDSQPNELEQPVSTADQASDQPTEQPVSQDRTLQKLDELAESVSNDLVLRFDAYFDTKVWELTWLKLQQKYFPAQEDSGSFLPTDSTPLLEPSPIDDLTKVEA